MSKAHSTAEPGILSHPCSLLGCSGGASTGTWEDMTQDTGVHRLLLDCSKSPHAFSFLDLSPLPVSKHSHPQTRGSKRDFERTEGLECGCERARIRLLKLTERSSFFIVPLCYQLPSSKTGANSV